MMSFASAGESALPVPIAQIGSYATTQRATSATGTPSNAACTCAHTLSRACPAACSSAVSPTATIGVIPCASAARAFSLTR